jgi:hypothetical protein
VKAKIRVSAQQADAVYGDVISSIWTIFEIVAADKAGVVA